MDLLTRPGICRSWGAQGKVGGLPTGCMQHDVEVEAAAEEIVRLDMDSENEHENIDVAVQVVLEKEHENTDVAVQVALEKALVSHSPILSQLVHIVL